MTKRNPVSATQNIWFDAEQVDNTDLTLEQQYNTAINSAIINNHIGSGVVPEVLVQHVIFDSSLSSGNLDGIAVSAQSQPVDTNFGNQLEIELTGSEACGKRTIKVAIIGLDFESNLQFETFVFSKNEMQIGKRHFASVSVILFNDFVGDPTYSMNLGGRVIIRETKPMSLSRDPIMLSQDIEPNLFFRDFYVSGGISLRNLLQTALPYYNIDTLGIYTAAADQKILLSNDIVTQIGQKFIATTNNIQKLSFLLSVRNTVLGEETDLAWTGDLVASIYSLQSNIECPTDIAPNLAIEFSPTNIPLAQVSFTYSSLLAAGTLLNSVPQQVDFVFSNSPIAGGNILTVGNYYAITLKRAGSADKCDIILDVGSDLIDNSRITIFTGTVWVDLPEEDLWFKIWTDAAKISDGQAYDSGNGMVLEKTIIDSVTQTTVDNSYDGIQFTGNDVYKAVASAVTVESDSVADQRTGQPVNSKQKLVTDIQLLNSIDIANLTATAEPLILGAISDKNKKYYDPSDSTIISKIHGATVVNDEILLRIITDTTDTGRYDLAVNELESRLLLGDLTDAKITPNIGNPSVFYRIADAKLCSMMVGDVNGDGIVDIDDLNLLNTYSGFNFNSSPPLNTSVTSDGYYTSFVNGYSTLTVPFSSAYTLSFQLIDSDGYVVESGTDGVLVTNPTDNRLAQFTSATVSFNTIIGLSNYRLAILTSSPVNNYGVFDISALDSVNDVITIRKVYLDGDVVAQLLRADIDGDFSISVNDGYLLENYINCVPYTNSMYEPYPAPATNPYTKIGTRFNVIRLKVERFVDRIDDYSSITIGRPTEIHPIQDIFVGDGYFANHDFYTYPAIFSINKELTWKESLIVTNSRPKLVPSVFTSLTGYTSNSCVLDGIICNTYPLAPDFNSGRVDLFAPDNVIIGEGGELYRSNGDLYKVDFELGTIVLEIPNGLYDNERTINLMDDFVASTIGDNGPTGITKFGFPAMKFADCSYVTADSLSNDQVRFSVAVQSFSPNTNGISEEGYTGGIVDGKMGISVDYETGLLTLNFTNLYEDAILRTLSTKVQISVYLKKGSFNNKPLFVDSTKVQNMLSLISVFSTVDDGPSALIDLEADVTGILPIVHGGTGISTLGAAGTILSSTGTGLSYQFVYDLPYCINYSTGIPDANKIPKTDGYGKLDPSFYYKNPVYIYGVAGIDTHDGYAPPKTIGAFSFRFDKYILEGLSDIKLEVILETTNALNTAQIKLYDVTSMSYLDLIGILSPIYTLDTTNTAPTVLLSKDLTSQLLTGEADYIYEIHLALDPVGISDYAICKMARLVITYNNPNFTAYP